MNMSAVFKDSLIYPFQDIKQFIILFILFLGAFTIIIPIILVFGYLYRIIERTLQGSDFVPDFEGLKEITVNGLKYLGVYLLISTLPIYIINLALMSTGIPIITSNVVVINIISIIAGLLINAVFFMSLGNMISENKFYGAFEFKKIGAIIQKITWKRYLTYLVVYTVLFQIFIFIANLISNLIYFGNYFSTQIISLLLIIIPAIFYTYLFMFTSRSIGLIYPVNSENLE